MEKRFEITLDLIYLEKQFGPKQKTKFLTSQGKFFDNRETKLSNSSDFFLILTFFVNEINSGM